ncbi:MAG: hypothetical protein CM1200mP28_03350 [Deltaproteobacteria bacterium]|nr:MAG: hypothetical protein CM1200mP28_03350 [Deltaproteobacteria bacterium]
MRNADEDMEKAAEEGRLKLLAYGPKQAILFFLLSTNVYCPYWTS